MEIKKGMKQILVEFRDFLREYKVIGLAIALIIGLAANTLVKSLVNDIIMPIVTFFIPGGAWRTATVHIGPIVLGLGAFVGEIVNFIVVAFVVFLIAKMLLKEDKVSKK